MSDIEQKTPTTSQTINTSGLSKSKKSLLPKKALNISKINQFFAVASKRQKISEKRDGEGFIYAESSNLLQGDFAQPTEFQEMQIKPFQDKLSTVSQSSPDQKTLEDPIPTSEESSDKQTKPKDQSVSLKGSSVANDQSAALQDDQLNDPESQMEDLSHIHQKRPNRDHCNKCKDGGDLLCCDNCPRSFHFKCLGVKEGDIPEGEWYCITCVPIVEKKKKQDEEKRLRNEERERLMAQRKEQREKATKDKEMEIERKRQEKMLDKQRKLEEINKQKEADLEELRRKMYNQGDGQNSLLSNNFGQNLSMIQANSPLKSKNGLSTGIDSPGHDNLEAQAKKKKAAQANPAQRKGDERTEVEKSRDQRAKSIKEQMKIFQSVYSELVDKNTIKYPIEDKLIKKMPLLHGAENFPEKPALKKVLINGVDFEKLLYVWEFFNNFNDFLDIQNFKMEELQAALIFNQREDKIDMFSQPEINEEDQEPDWEEQQTTKEVAENGFGLVSQIHTALINVFLKEVKQPDNKASKNQDPNEVNEDQDNLILMIKKYIEKPDQTWPEYLRVILTSKKAFSFQPLDPNILAICHKLQVCTPRNYSSLFTYDEKLELLSTLIDGVHDLDDFRQFLNSRLEEKSGYNKQKIEVYAELKQLEIQKQELIKERNAKNANNQGEKEAQIEALKATLGEATRSQAKGICSKIDELSREVNKIAKEMAKIEDQIEKKHGRIEKLNEQILQTSIKNSLLGKDCDKNEYWFFKEDTSKLFVKKFDPIVPQPVERDDNGNEIMVIQDIPIKVPSFSWYYYETEEEFNKLLESCNVKGIRERKLQENLRKIAERMKLKKSKAAKPIVKSNEKLEEEKQDVEMIDVEDVKEQEEAQAAQDNKHYIYETDDYYQSLMNAVWFNKKMPSKRQVSMEQRGRIATRKAMGLNIQVQQKEASVNKNEQISLELIRRRVLEMEALFTDSSLQFDREWDYKNIRDIVINKINSSQSIEELAQQLQRLETGFCHPHQLKYQDDKSKPQQEDEVEASDSQQSEEESVNGKEEFKQDKNVSAIKLRFVKFWPTEEIKQAWRHYIFEECQDNINALYISMQIIEIVAGEFIQRQLDTQTKKAQKKNGGMANQNKSKDIKPAEFGGRREKKNYQQYFESSDEEQSAKKPQQQQKRGGRKKVIDDSDESMSSQQSDEESEEENREWNDKCMTCRKGGLMLCCEDCPNVCHQNCLGLKQQPAEWRCEDCKFKLTRKRTTRGAIKLSEHQKVKGGLRYR